MRDSNRGLFGLVLAIIGSAFCISLVTASVSHWPIVLLGIGAGLWAVQTRHTVLNRLPRSLPSSLSPSTGDLT